MRLALLPAFAACAWAQLQIDIHYVAGRPSDQLKEVKRILQVAQRSPLRDAGAPEELAVVEGVGKIYRSYFRPEINSISRIATFTDNGSDILVIRWAASDKDVFSELIAWDTPEGTSFIFKFPPHSWSSESAIRGIFEKLLPTPVSDPWSRGPSGVVLNVAKDAETQQWTGAGGLRIVMPPRSYDVGSGNGVDLWETTDASYLRAWFNPFLNSGYSQEMRWIPERFPPLETRVGQWTIKRLIDELAGSRDFRSDNRDRILARELMKRELTQDELLAALESSSKESEVVLRAVAEADRVQHFADAIGRYLPSDRWGDTKAGGHPFDIVQRIKDVDFTDIALAVLRQYPRAAAARRYVIEHGATWRIVP